MVGFRSWLFISAVFAASLCGISAEIKLTTSVGRLFTYEVMRETFQKDFDSYSLKLYTGVLHDDPMIFKCNQQYFPDLPEWLRFIQRHPSENGFLYGTPTSPGKTFIEIYAVNKNSYDTVRNVLVIKAVPEKMLPYQAEFFIELREIEKVLPSSVQSEIKQDLQKLWNNEALEIVNITNALDRGGRVPLPLAGHYEGVYVKVGSKKYFSRCLQRVMTPEYQRQCAAGDRVKVPGECHFCKIPSNCITWCKTKLFDRTKMEPAPPAPTMGSGILEDGGYFDPPESPPSRDYFPDYIVSVIVPLIIAFLLCLLLAYILYGRREGVAKRNAKTDNIQLYHQQTIHGNTEELRSMAAQRGVPPPLSTLPMFNSRTGERASPVQSDSIPLIMAQQDPYSDTLPRK
ncbi:alpha-sarcoglycan isoform X2 [Xiphophorus couchianus]|uniref:alpha-sarcoglycan isoform X2 n=2 Tax=Xiphophorus couchianus TaxID=32473 RepID=UPI00101649EB|nr:alpha-sarcoglycan isoform X2 [Xiphophorus couchianus]